MEAAKIQPKVKASGKSKLQAKDFEKLFAPVYDLSGSKQSPLKDSADLMHALQNHQAMFVSIASDESLAEKVRARFRKALPGVLAFHKMLSGAEDLEFAFVLPGAQAASLSPKQAHFLFDQTVLRLGNGQRDGKSLLESFMADRQLKELRDKLLRMQDPASAVPSAAGSSNSRNAKRGDADRGSSGGSKSAGSHKKPAGQAKGPGKDQATRTKRTELQREIFSFLNKANRQEPNPEGFDSDACFAFNAGGGCTRRYCKHTKTCAFCKGKKHALADPVHLEAHKPKIPASLVTLILNERAKA
jgi:hypothetical protein